MLHFLKRRNKKKGIIALNIGSDVVKGIFFVPEEKQGQGGEVIGRRGIVKGVSEVLQNGSDVGGNVVTDIARVIENCKKAIQMASRSAGMEPAQLVMGVAGESIKGATSTFSHKREDPTSKINLSELYSIVHKLEWKAFAEVRREISEEIGHPEIDVKLVNSSVVDTRIDGYKVTNPLGFQGKEVQMSIFNSFAPLSHYAALHNIADSLNLEFLGIVSEAYALSRSMEQENPNLSAIFIDVGGSVTDIAVVKDGALMGTRVFGVGGRTFTKRIAIELNISFHEAEKLKLAYSDDKLEQKSKKIISNIIENDIEVWLEGVVLSLSEFKKIDVLPSRILLSGGGSYLPEIRDCLNNRKWYKKLPFQHTPEAHFMRFSDLGNIIDESKTIKDQKNIAAVALVNIGLELSGEENLVQKSLRKVIGIMKV